jgi:UDP-N-acetylglucosamine 4-epimerase
VASRYPNTAQTIRSRRETWLVTGAAGFIGSNLVERLIELDQQVVGLDNFATGHRRNVDQVARDAGDRFRFIEGDIRDLATCRAACEGARYVLHQAALGSVPRSVDDPVTTNAANIGGFLNMLVAARDARAKRFVYAASSAAYGDEPTLPKVEDRIGAPLSPYAVTKLVNELYAGVFHRLYGTEVIGLRYFNVFGPRQDPDGAYAAVIPRWIGNLLRGEPCQIYGDGTASRDFCYIENAVQANLLAATIDDHRAIGEVYNIACGQRTTIAELHDLIRDRVRALRPSLSLTDPEHTAPRPGDVVHSLADISRARRLLGYWPSHDLRTGLAATIDWFAASAAEPAATVKP